MICRATQLPRGDVDDGFETNTICGLKVMSCGTGVAVGTGAGPPPPGTGVVVGPGLLPAVGVLPGVPPADGVPDGSPPVFVEPGVFCAAAVRVAVACVPPPVFPPGPPLSVSSPVTDWPECAPDPGRMPRPLSSEPAPPRIRPRMSSTATAPKMSQRRPSAPLGRFTGQRVTRRCSVGVEPEVSGNRAPMARDGCDGRGGSIGAGAAPGKACTPDRLSPVLKTPERAKTSDASGPVVEGSGPLVARLSTAWRRAMAKERMSW